jgi:ornithine decarboxylase
MSNRFVALCKQSYAPIAVYSPYSVRRKLLWWRELFPTIAPYYAIKSFDHPRLLKTASRTGLLGGFDVASADEVKKVAHYGLPMIHSNPIKTNEDISVAMNAGVKLHVCHDIDTIKQVRAIHPTGKIVWRIHAIEEHSRIQFNEKFGASLEETVRMLETTEYPIYGISFHVGSSCGRMCVFPEMLRFIQMELFPIWIRTRMTLPLLVDIGGGFRGIDEIQEISKEMTQLTEEWRRRYGTEFIAEPGRYISEDSIRLYTRVIAVKRRGDHYNIYINDSIYQSFSCIIFDKAKPVPSPMYGGVDKVECTIWGNTCDSVDRIIKTIRLPLPRVGDVFRWDNMGAYTIVSSTRGFNGFSSPTIVSCD